MIVIDLSRGFTDPESPLGAELGSVLDATARLLRHAREHGVPVLHTTVEYDDAGREQASVFLTKIPALRVLEEGSQWCELDPAVAPVDGEPVLSKRFASGFFGTDLAERLRALGVDTVILAGVSTSGCVRATAVDALQWNLRVLVPREAVGDRNPAAHEANLFDIDAKYGDVISLDEALAVISATARGVPDRRGAALA